ncbi:dynamin family protein [Marinobacterium stanieri]|uniref:dynamin family protein n=1 Tax=Marinobacterium stanieri TaxID=49186 RepID=UPI003A8DF853
MMTKAQHPMINMLDTHKPLIGRYLEPCRCEQFDKHLTDELARNRPSIMVYGVYSAGKSSLINALFGEKVAVEGRSPTTEKVTRYEFGDFSIDDTPGVDAPPEHEKVSREQLEKSDLVLFVVSSSTVLDDLHTYQAIMELVSLKHRVMLVINQRDMSIDCAYQVKVNDEIRQQLQEKSQQMCVPEAEALAAIPIHWVNARLGLEGKLTQKSLLLHSSGLPEFEQALSDFIAATDYRQREQRLAAEFERVLAEAQSALQLQMDALGTSGYQRFATRLQQEQTAIQCRLEGLLRQQGQALSATFKDLALAEMDDDQLEQQLSSHIQRLIQEVEEQLQQELNAAVSRLELLEAELDSERSAVRAQVDLPSNIQLPETEKKLVSDEGGEGLLPKGSLQTLVQQIKSEHLVEAMRLAKTLLPSLFKGVGQKTMEKWAEIIIQKVRWGGPLLQMGVQLIGGLYQHYQANQEMRQQQEAMVRFHEAVRAGAAQIATQYQQSVSACVLEVLHQALQPAIDHIEDAVAQINKQSLDLAKDANQLAQLVSQLQLEYGKRD